MADRKRARGESSLCPGCDGWHRSKERERRCVVAATRQRTQEAVIALHDSEDDENCRSDSRRLLEGTVDNLLESARGLCGTEDLEAAALSETGSPAAATVGVAGEDCNDAVLSAGVAPSVESSYGKMIESETLVPAMRMGIQIFYLSMRFGIPRLGQSVLCGLMSPDTTVHRVAAELRRRTGVSARRFHTCGSTCRLFLAEGQDQEKGEIEARCRECDKRTAENVFYYPLDGRLGSWFGRRPVARELNQYASSLLEHGPPSGPHFPMRDVFDGAAYRDAVQQGRIPDKNAVVIWLSFDAVPIFKKKVGSVTAFYVLMLSLPPHRRTLQKFIHPLLLIPGPSEPKNLQSFVDLLVDEFLRLEEDGVEVYDAWQDKVVRKRVFLLGVGADLKAREKLFGYRGTGAVAPCLNCGIVSVPVPVTMNSRKMVKSGFRYPVLRVPRNYTLQIEPPRPRNYLPSTLPARDAAEFAWLLDLSSNLRNEKRLQDRRGKSMSEAAVRELLTSKGIKKGPLPRLGLTLSAMTATGSAPMDLMHTAMNLAKQLAQLVKGSEGSIYPRSVPLILPLPPGVVSEIDAALDKAKDTSPTAFGRPPGLLVNSGSWKAEECILWLTTLFPVVLFAADVSRKELKFFADLARYMRLLVRVPLHEESFEVLIRLRDAVPTLFEELFVADDPAAVSNVKPNLHNLCHAPEDILRFGPKSTTWQFWMESTLGQAVEFIANRSDPYTNLGAAVERKLQLDAATLDADIEAALQSVSNLERKHGGPGTDTALEGGSSRPGCTALGPGDFDLQDGERLTGLVGGAFAAERVPSFSESMAIARWLNDNGHGNGEHQIAADTVQTNCRVRGFRSMEKLVGGKNGAKEKTITITTRATRNAMVTLEFETNQGPRLYYGYVHKFLAARFLPGFVDMGSDVFPVPLAILSYTLPGGKRELPGDTTTTAGIPSTLRNLGYSTFSEMSREHSAVHVDLLRSVFGSFTWRRRTFVLDKFLAHGYYSLSDE